jgi:hypothetical protein
MTRLTVHSAQNRTQMNEDRTEQTVCTDRQMGWDMLLLGRFVGVLLPWTTGCNPATFHVRFVGGGVVSCQDFA